MKKLILSALLAALALGAQAKVELPALISDNMVLQQSGEARLWGKAAPSSTVVITPSWPGAKAVTVKSAKDGKWQATIATPAADNKPYTLTFADRDGEVTVSNVLLGEVWLASGQSNMEMPLRGFDGCPVKGGYEEIARAGAYADRIHMINIPKKQSYEPCDEVEAAWTVASPETAANYSATGWYFAQRLADILDVPIGIVNAAYGGARVESWLPREILETYADESLDPAVIEKMTDYHRPMLMYNAMFLPIKDYTYKGIIWYQGCSNVGAPTFGDRLTTMIEHWRKEIGLGDIPFYSCEIAPYAYSPDGTGIDGALLREQQWQVAESIPNGGIVSTNDLVESYELYNIHPGNKQAVGQRLGNLALNKTYGKRYIPAEGLKYNSCRAVDGEMWVKLDMPQGGGVARNYMIEGFELAGTDGVFHPADKAWLHWQTNEVVVSSSEVPEPVAVRYGFRDWLPGTMYGHNYLPLTPFRSDK